MSEVEELRRRVAALEEGLALMDEEWPKFTSSEFPPPEDSRDVPWPVRNFVRRARAALAAAGSGSAGADEAAAPTPAEPLDVLPLLERARDFVTDYDPAGELTDALDAAIVRLRGTSEEPASEGGRRDE